MVLTDSWLSVWAKSDPHPPGVLAEWLPLHQHLDDTAGVAANLIDHWVPTPVLRRIAEDLGNPDHVKTLTVWLAAVHDVGKASPAFALQVKTLCDHMRRHGLPADPRLAESETRSRINHALVGHLAVRDWLADHLGLDAETTATQWASVVGSHHGITPEWTRLSEAEEQVDFTGTGDWAKVRDGILERAAERAGRDRLIELGLAKLSTPSLALLTAIVIVADWIASNSEYFPLRPIETLDAPDSVDDVRTAARLAHGWAELGLPPRWTAPEPADPPTTFAARFGRPADTIRDVQRKAAQAARTTNGLLIIEAPMGSGKTEAALLAAEVMAHSTGANGCFVALPTQATTDAMFSRVRSWLDRIPGGGTLTLAHGKAHLNDEFAGLVRKGRFTTDGTAAHDWLRGRKKAGLSSFVVGTIDQILFAGLKSRHVMLRHLALAGKVVIIDEVHAYDVYMSRYLHRVLHWLGAYRVPVVLLSATLPDARRADLIRAYESGRGDAESAVPDGHPGYPVITGSHGLTPQTFPLPARTTPVTIDHLDDDLDTLADYLGAHLEHGGCAVVVRNTVTRVQETAAHLATDFDVTINHARFLACDRAALDRDLLRRFGPPEQAQNRPLRHVVVASQVVEQSLDIDFDLMVTDLAPIDLVLQRMGRLHRHSRPERTRAPRCAITGADWSTEPPEPGYGSRKVYDTHHLLRAAALLDRAEIALPHDIATLVQSAYGTGPLGPASWQPAMAAAEQDAAHTARLRSAAAQTYLLPEARTGDLVDWLHAGAGEANDDNAHGMAQVRDGAESLEVLVVQRDADGGLRTPDWIKGGGQQIPLFGELPWPLVRVISACSLRLPYALCHGGVIDQVISQLEKTKVASFQETRSLRGLLLLTLDDNRTTDLHGYRLTYDPLRGLLHDRL